MKKIVIYLLTAIAFIQCKKDKDASRPPDLSKELLAYFPFDGNFNDSTGQSENISYGGLMSDTKNRHGYSQRAYSFNGGLFSFSSNNWQVNPITISFWIKPKDLTMEGYLLRSSTGNFGVYQSKTKLGLAISNPEEGIALAEITTEWTHFVGMFNGNDIKTYINGKLATTLNHPGVPDIAGTIMIGASTIPEWKGIVDDVRFYHRLLSDAEINILAGQ
jgi:hypothetical protein